MKPGNSKEFLRKMLADIGWTRMQLGDRLKLPRHLIDDWCREASSKEMPDALYEYVRDVWGAVHSITKPDLSTVRGRGVRPRQQSGNRLT